MQKRTDRLGRLARAIVLACLLLSGFGGLMLAPTPAYAQLVPTNDKASNIKNASGWAEEFENWKKQGSLLAKIITGITDFIDLIKDKYDEIFGEQSTTTAAELMAKEADIKADVKIADAAIDKAYARALKRAVMNAKSRHIHSRTQILCKDILVHQLVTTTEDHERAVARMAASAIENMYRGPKEDGNGPQYARDNYQDRCDMKFASPVDYPDECVDTSTKGTDGRKIQDADLNFCTLTGGQVLEMPDTKAGGTEGTSALDPQNTEQRFWIAGLYYCFNLAGPRPSPPYGDQISTPRGAVVKAQWDSCAAKQSALMKPCLELLAYHTRPNAKETEVIEEQKTKCLAADRAGIELPESFEKCEKGLSPYQAEYLAQAMCKSTQYYISQKLAGAKDYLLSSTSLECSMSWDLWKENAMKKQIAVAKSIDGLLGLANCWGNTRTGR